jgi:hypothetical protein
MKIYSSISHTSPISDLVDSGVYIHMKIRANPVQFIKILPATKWLVLFIRKSSSNEYTVN